VTVTKKSVSNKGPVDKVDDLPRPSSSSSSGSTGAVAKPGASNFKPAQPKFVQ